MIRFSNKCVLALALSVGFGTTSLAQQVVTTRVGLPAKFQIESYVVNAELKQCSIIVTKPSGATEIVILQAPHFKTELSFTPMMQGTTVVSWQGESTLNGKAENIVVGGVKQLFNNIGELVTLKKMVELVVACPGSGTITIVATQGTQPTVPRGGVPGYAPDSSSM
jgi:hypothetical protein